MSEKDLRPGSPGWWQRRTPKDKDRDQRPGRPSMPIDRVITAAVELVDQVGPAEFSMRMLAQHLRSSTATLYRNFASKDEILVHVLDHVLGEVPGNLTDMDTASTSRELLIAMAHALFQTLKQHPNVVPLLDNHIPLGPNALAAREAAIAMLLSSGLPPDTAAPAYTAFARYVVGFASQLRASEPDQGEADEIRTFYRTLDPARFPATVTSAEYMPTALDEEFQFGLQLLLDGLTAHLTRSGQAQL